MSCTAPVAETSSALEPAAGDFSASDVTAEAVASHTGAAASAAAAGLPRAAPSLSMATRLVHPPKVRRFGHRVVETSHNLHLYYLCLGKFALVSTCA